MAEKTSFLIYYYKSSLSCYFNNKQRIRIELPYFNILCSHFIESVFYKKYMQMSWENKMDAKSILITLTK
jgi:hypothetical protein